MRSVPFPEAAIRMPLSEAPETDLKAKSHAARDELERMLELLKRLPLQERVRCAYEKLTLDETF